MKRFFFAASIASLVLASCGSGQESSSTETNTTTTDSPVITPAPDTTTNALPQVPPVVTTDTNRTSSTIKTPPVVLPVANSQPATAAASVPAGNVALNPEHGKPGHRCDIAVGAPLNSPAGANTASTPTVTTTPVTAAPATSAAPAKTSGNVRLNPAHGLPGHDCSVEVGKPLKN